MDPGSEYGSDLRTYDTYLQKVIEMSRSVNKIILIGRVGSDPDVRVTSSGVKISRVSLATNWRTGGNDPEERTDWHRVKPMGPIGTDCRGLYQEGR